MLIDTILDAYGHQTDTTIFPPDAYGTHLACLHETPTWICGLAARLSHTSWDQATAEADRTLLQRLTRAGDEHAKALRGKTYTILLTAARYVWAEMDTYTVGRQPLGSTSTMHTDAKGLTGDDLVALKDSLREGLLQTRVFVLSYQTAQRIIRQRRTHRLPQWHYICDCLTTLTEAL